MEHGLLLFYAAFFGLAALVVAAMLQQEKERRDAFAKTAVRLGLKFEPRADALIEEYGVLPLFSHGHTRRTANVMGSGAGDRPSAVFDYQYTVGSGKSSTTTRQTVAVFHFEGKSLPSFTLEPEGALHKLGEAFGYHDLDFQSHPGFSAAYFLKGQDQGAVRQLFQLALLAHFQQERGWQVEGGADRLAVYRSGTLVKPEELYAFVEGAARIARLFRGS
jgi:hypothetical protein